MKLTEIADYQDYYSTLEKDADGFLKDRRDINGYFSSALGGGSNPNYFINDNNEIVVKSGDVRLSGEFGVSMPRDRLLVRFAEVNSSFILAVTPLKSFAGFPAKCKNMVFRYPKFSSLVGFEKIVQELEELIIIDDGDSIKEGGIGLLHIKNLKKITHDVQDSILTIQRPTALEIISKYVGKLNDIYDCQAELLDAGYEEYAKL